MDCSPGSGTAAPKARINHVKKIRDNLQVSIKKLKADISVLEAEVSDLNQSIKANKNERKREKVNKNTIIDSYTIPKEIGDASCISALSGCSVIELAKAF